MNTKYINWGASGEIHSQTHYLLNIRETLTSLALMLFCILTTL